MPRSLRGRTTSAQTAEKSVSFGAASVANSHGYWLGRITKRSSIFDGLGSKPSAAQTPSLAVSLAESSLLIALLTIAPLATAQAGGFCERVASGPDLPNGLAGRYEAIGREANTGKPYLAGLFVSLGQDAYTLERTVRGKAVKGEAWFEACGPDKIKSLFVRYHTRPATEQYCTLAVDGDNYFRATCRSRQGAGKWLGLESWFQAQ